MKIEDTPPARIPIESRVRVQRPTGEWVALLVTSALDLAKPDEPATLTLQRPLFIGAPRLRERIREMCHERFVLETVFRTGDGREYGVRSRVTFTGAIEGLMLSGDSAAVDVLTLPVVARLPWEPTPGAWDGELEL